MAPPSCFYCACIIMSFYCAHLIICFYYAHHHLHLLHASYMHLLHASYHSLLFRAPNLRFYCILICFYCPLASFAFIPCLIQHPRQWVPPVPPQKSRSRSESAILHTAALTFFTAFLKSYSAQILYSY